MSKPVAWVPIHPRNGPLWAMATDKPDPERLPNSYPLRPLAFADEAQAAPAPEPSAQTVAHPSHQTVREWMPVSEALRLSDLWTAGDLDNCGQWRAAIKVLADEVRALAASPQPAEPSAQAEARVYDIMALADKMAMHYAARDIPTGELYRGIAERQWLESRAELRAALAASPQPEPSAQGDPVACDRDAPVCPWCDRQGWDICQHADDARTCGK